MNDSLLIHPKTGEIINKISHEQAVAVVQAALLQQYTPRKTERITEICQHSKYRGRPLPALSVFETHNRAGLISYG